jgi:hypothetical protein
VRAAQRQTEERDQLVDLYRCTVSWCVVTAARRRSALRRDERVERGGVAALHRVLDVERELIAADRDDRADRAGLAVDDVGVVCVRLPWTSTRSGRSAWPT